MDNDFGVGRFVKDEIRVRRRVQAANNRISGADPDMRMRRKKVDDRLGARLNAFGALRRMRGDVIKCRAEIGQGRKGITDLHRPCLAQVARTCSSVANSPRSAATLERAIAVRSSAESATGSVSLPASSRRMRARSS